MIQSLRTKLLGSLLLIASLIISPKLWANTHTRVGLHFYSARNTSYPKLLSDALQKASQNRRPFPINCDIHTIVTADDKAWFQHHQNSSHNSVYLFLNGEDTSASDNAKLLSNDHVLFLGTFWNETLMEYDSPLHSSLWIPFASLSFADRDISPLKLLDVNPSPRSESIVYQQSKGCSPYELGYKLKFYRQLFWDRLNRELINIGTIGTATGECNGIFGLGKREENIGRYNFSNSVENYSRFKFTLNMEHDHEGINYNGYLTEKIVDGFLAGSVPVYAGSHMVGEIFNENRFLHVKPEENEEEIIQRIIEMLGNERLYEEFRKRKVMSEENIKKYFSWHPSVWEKFGDDLAQRIIDVLEEKCTIQSSQSAQFIS